VQAGRSKREEKSAEPQSSRLDWDIHWMIQADWIGTSSRLHSKAETPEFQIKKNPVD
jgi:hypothetical protein